MRASTSYLPLTTSYLLLTTSYFLLIFRRRTILVLVAVTVLAAEH